MTLSIPVGDTKKLPSINTTFGTSSIMTSKDERSEDTPPLSKLDLYSNLSMTSVPTIAIKVFGLSGPSTGLTGSVGSLTFCVLSPVKFLIAIIKESRFGTSPGRFTELGASPIIVNIELISS